MWDEGKRGGVGKRRRRGVIAGKRGTREEREKGKGELGFVERGRERIYV